MQAQRGFSSTPSSVRRATIYLGRRLTSSYIHGDIMPDNSQTYHDGAPDNQQQQNGSGKAFHRLVHQEFHQGQEFALPNWITAINPINVTACRGTVVKRGDILHRISLPAPLNDHLDWLEPAQLHLEFHRRGF